MDEQLIQMDSSKIAISDTFKNSEQKYVMLDLWAIGNPSFTFQFPWSDLGIQNKMRVRRVGDNTAPIA